MPKIDHIVYVMFENRSFDNVLGWLDRDHGSWNTIGGDGAFTFDGLDASRDFNVDGDGVAHYVVEGTNGDYSVPRSDPHEDFAHVTAQLFEDGAPPRHGAVPSMGGFLRDYAGWLIRPEEIMMGYTPDELHVLNGLARSYAVSDRYFSSVPTETNCNRAFATTGGSLGVNADGKLEAFVDNRGSAMFELGHPKRRQFNQRSMFTVLSEHGRDRPSDWMVFNSQGDWLEDLLGAQGYAYTRAILEELQPASFDAHFSTVGDPRDPGRQTFFGRVASGQLPALCLIEPKWGLPAWRLPLGMQGTDYHPPTDVRPGEALLKAIYDALTTNRELWDRTLLIVNFDEHGGTYDHVPPPWTAAAPWAQDHGTPTPDVCEAGFGFDRFGVRVPLIVASPWIREKTLFRARGEVPYDHTSVIGTVLRLMGIPAGDWRLGSRVAHAPTFEDVLTDERRADVPPLDPPPG